MRLAKKILLLAIVAATAIYFAVKVQIHTQNFAIENEADPGETEMNNTAVHLTSSQAFSNYLSNISNIGIFNYAGAINCLVVDEADSNHLIAGANNGGIWFSNNRGLSWNPVNDFANSLRTTSIAQNHFRHNEFYYSTGDDIYDHGNLLNDVYRSTDGGITFTNVTSTTPGIGRIHKIVCSPVDSNTVYLISYSGSSSVAYGGALYRTTDNFNTIQQLYHIPNYDLYDLMVMPNGEVAFTEYGKIWQSSTGNAGSFVLCNNGLPATGVGRIKIAHCQSQPLIRYATVGWGNYNGIFKSIDGGLNWAIVDTFGNSPAPFKISVKPDDPDFIICGQVSLTASTDGGSTWQYTAGGYDIRSINFDPWRAGKVFITSDFGIGSIEVDPFTATSFSKEYYHDSLLIVQEIHAGDHFAQGDQSIQGHQDLGTRLIKPNLSDVFCQGGDGVTCFGSKQDSNVAYFSSQNGYIFKATNILTSSNGNLVTHQLDSNNDYSIDEGAPFLTMFLMNDSDDQQLYFPTYKRLWRSLDGAANWSPVSGYYGNTHYRLLITASKKINPIVYWCNYDSIFVLPDAATAVPLSEFGFPVPALAKKIIVDPFNDSCLYFIRDILVPGQPQEILHSGNVFNGPVAWTNWGVNFPVDVTPTCLAFYPNDPQIAFVGSYQGGIYITTDGAVTWTKESAFPNVQIKDIKIRPSDKKIFIYTYGRGVWTATYSNPLTTEAINPVTVSVYPNPFNEQFLIRMDQNIRNATITLIDFQGKIVYSTTMDIGRPVSIQTAGIAQGIYLLQLKAGNKIVVVKKVVKN